VNIVLAHLHEIEEFDQVSLLSGLGYDVFSIGAYEDPHHHEGLRPALPQAPDHPELRAACQRQREKMNDAWGEPGVLFDWAKVNLPDEVIDWMDVFIVHEAEHTFIPHQWDRIKHKRVVWRSVGQTVEHNENVMRPYRAEGLQRVAYSPREANIPGYTGHDALIRFYADPDVWTGWTGTERVVINITQHLYQRDPYTNWLAWDSAKRAVPSVPFLALGPGSEEIGGPGALSYDDMRRWLRRARAYFYTGTQPAPYTLGLVEAMMTGIPTFSIDGCFMRVFPYGHELFEADQLVTRHPGNEAYGSFFPMLMEDNGVAEAISAETRARAIELFGKETIGAQWRAFLG
jgi:glycosyltransferase involved in cell wall biosynthesis